jgi:serralysin
LSPAEKALPIFACLAAQPDEVAGFACACHACQAVWKPLAAPGPGPAPANAFANAPANASATAPADIPGDSTSTSTIALGTPITGVLEVNGDHDWYAVDLVAGTRYQITLNGVAVEGYGALEDPYIYLRNASGALIAQNDDIRAGVLRNSRLNWVATASGQYFLDASSWEERFVGGYQLSIIQFTPPTYTLDEIANFLTTGFWGDGGRRWDTRTDYIITYNVTGLTADGQTLARAAFQSWANVTNLVFQEVTSGGDISLDDNQSGAFASSSVSGGFITSAGINIGTGWLNSYGTAIDSYSFQTYVHEIGHTLGFGHGGAYDGTATYGVDNLYQNDIWSYTIMSYFDQVDAQFGSYRYVMGPSVADILAVQNLYGANTSFNTGNNVYGRNATAGSLYDFAAYVTTPAFTIYDAGGADTLDASGYGANQIINLNPEAFSSIGGLAKNIAIARNVMIEAAIGGDGDDSMIGNAAENMLSGNAGADTLMGGTGSDSLYGGAGNDLLIADGLGDYIDGGEGDDVILLGNAQLADILALFALTT